MISFLKQRVTLLVYPFVRLYWRVMKPRGYGARAIVLHDNQILLVKTVYGTYWGTPGGMMSRGESPEACALRELKEETGITGEIAYKLGTYASAQEGKRDTIHVFVVRADKKDLSLEWELASAQWFSLDALPQDVSPATKRRLEEMRAGGRDIQGAW